MSDFIELAEPEVAFTKSLGWYVRARKTEKMGLGYFLTKQGIVEQDNAVGADYERFYFDSEDAAIEASMNYYKTYNEEYPYKSLSNKSIQMVESQIMNFK